MAKTCNQCSDNGITIPFATYELGMARYERENKRLWLAILVLIAALVVSNVLWLAFQSQYEQVDITQDVEQQADDGGSNVFIGGDSYGEANDKNTN